MPTGPVTLTLTVQDVPGLKVAPDRDTEVDPPLPLAVPVHVLLRLLGVATTKFVGKVSVKATLFRVELALLLLTIRVSVEVAPKTMLVGAKDLVMLGGLMTVMLAVAGEVLVRPPASVAVTSLLVLFCRPSLTPFTATLTVQVVF